MKRGDESGVLFDSEFLLTQGLNRSDLYNRTMPDWEQDGNPVLKGIISAMNIYCIPVIVALGVTGNFVSLLVLLGE